MEGISGTTYKAVLVCHWCAEVARRRVGGVRSCEFTMLLLSWIKLGQSEDFQRKVFEIMGMGWIMRMSRSNSRRGSVLFPFSLTRRKYRFD